MTPNPARGAAPAAAPKKMSGCLIALMVFGALLSVSCLVGGFVVWRATQSDTGKKVFAAMGKGMEIAAKGMNAPGAAELREAGCPQAMVMDPGDVVEIVGEFFDAGVDKLKDKDKLHQM